MPWCTIVVLAALQVLSLRELTTIVNSDEADNPRDLVIDYQDELL